MEDIFCYHHSPTPKPLIPKLEPVIKLFPIVKKNFCKKDSNRTMNIHHENKRQQYVGTYCGLMCITIFKNQCFLSLMYVKNIMIMSLFSATRKKFSKMAKRFSRKKGPKLYPLYSNCFIIY